MQVYEASLMGVIRILLWLFLISMIIRLVARLALPVVIRKAEQTMRDRQNGFHKTQNSPRREGEVTIETPRTSAASKEGEYVDFVEIKE